MSPAPVLNERGSRRRPRGSNPDDGHTFISEICMNRSAKWVALAPLLKAGIVTCANQTSIKKTWRNKTIQIKQTFKTQYLWIKSCSKHFLISVSMLIKLWFLQNGVYVWAPLFPPTFKLETRFFCTYRVASIFHPSVLCAWASREIESRNGVVVDESPWILDFFEENLVWGLVWAVRWIAFSNSSLC